MVVYRDNYEIIKLFLDRGYRILKFYNIKCYCKLCINESIDDSFCYSRLRINVYRVLVSFLFIVLFSKDSILIFFELSWEFRRFSKFENEFKLDYEKLVKKC